MNAILTGRAPVGKGADDMGMGAVGQSGSSGLPPPQSGMDALQRRTQDASAREAAAHGDSGAVSSSEAQGLQVSTPLSNINTNITKPYDPRAAAVYQSNFVKAIRNPFSSR